MNFDIMYKCIIQSNRNAIINSCNRVAIWFLWGGGVDSIQIKKMVPDFHWNERKFISGGFGIHVILILKKKIKVLFPCEHIQINCFWCNLLCSPPAPPPTPQTKSNGYKLTYCYLLYRRSAVKIRYKCNKADIIIKYPPIWGIWIVSFLILSSRHGHQDDMVLTNISSWHLVSTLAKLSNITDSS